ncbi:MAG TPA: hypothetical protein VHX60_06405 [Acidobacteriaceae bacterium]|jgi:hypothetical protein|nr:hypothetical protein [Acidobacteriaceae bacterium]
MPLNETDRAWVRETIQNTLNINGRGRLARFTKDWSGAGAAIAIVLFMALQWTAYVEFRTQTNDRLGRIEGQLAKQTAVTQASLPASEFRAALPDLGSALQTMQKEKISISPVTVDAIQKKMIATESSALGYWPAAAEFISYRSRNQAQNPSQLLNANLPNCTDSDPHPPIVTNASPDRGPDGMYHGSFNGPYYENCRFELDSPDADSKVNSMLMARAPFLSFKHCLIVYRGGAIDLILAFQNKPYAIEIPEQHLVLPATPYLGPALIFGQCIFDFRLTAAPPPKGQDFTQRLLASDGMTLGFDVQNPQATEN